ncbi:hypothetical protein T07_5397, partial [Trichinella nelsoni]
LAYCKKMYIPLKACCSNVLMKCELLLDLNCLIRMIMQLEKR